ncbi:hypothetical protein TB1_031046 [Malus domestica]
MVDLLLTRIFYFLSASLFFYLLFKLGIFQCIGKRLCKMCWAAYETYGFALGDITCFLWHKLRNTRRIGRLRHFTAIAASANFQTQNKASVRVKKMTCGITIKT